MEAERVPKRRSGCCAAAARCALVLGVCALLVSLAGLTLILMSRQEPPASPAQLLRTPACARVRYNGSAILRNRTMKWVTSDTFGGVIFSQEFEYDNVSGMLKIKSEGVYHIYAQMVIQCNLENCAEQGNVNLIIHHKTPHNSDPILSLGLHLYPRSNGILSASMAILFPLKVNDSLHVTLTASTNSSSVESSGWQLKSRNIIFEVSEIPGYSKLQVTEKQLLLF